MGNADRTSDVLRVLGKFPRSDFSVGLLQEWGYLSDAECKHCLDGGDKRTKAEIVGAIVKILSKKKITSNDDAVGDLDLIHVQRYSRRKLWSVYELKKLTDDAHQPTFTSQQFAKKLQREMQNYFVRARVSVRDQDGIYWLRVEVRKEPRAVSRAASMLTYVVYHPSSDFLFISGLLVSIASTFLQAFLRVLDCSEANQKPLKGHCVASLAELAVYRRSQAAFKKFQSGDTQRNPLIRGRKRKQDVPEEEHLNTIICENIETKNQRQKTLDDNFGTEELPNLEKLDYKLETPFHGREFAPRMRQHKGTFHCRVKFEGTNVLEGLRELGEAGLTKIPLPSHLGQVHYQARNSFVLKQQ